MLYVTTASKYDTFTAHYTLCHNSTKDGGLFVPYRMPKLSAQEIDSLKEKSFGQRIADILNLFFSAKLSGWDVDSCVGRKPVRIVSLSNRILVAETWHNLDWDFDSMVRNLSNRLLAKEYAGRNPSNWAKTAVRIAVLIGIWGELEKNDPGNKIDIAVPGSGLSAAFAVWYAREMGLPVRTVVIGCDERSGIWDLFHQGQLPADSTSVPEGLECLVFAAVGYDAVQTFRNAHKEGKTYLPQRHVLEKLSRGMSAAVISPRRIESVIRNVYRDNGYIMDVDTAHAYSGLQDHLARVKENSTVLVLSEKSPIYSSVAISNAMGISLEELKNRLDIT